MTKPKECDCGVSATLNDDGNCPECAEKLDWDRKDYDKTREALGR